MITNNARGRPSTGREHISALATPSRASCDVPGGDRSTNDPGSHHMERQVRVAHLTTRLIVAGMGNVVAHIIGGLPPHRYHSFVWCLEEADMLGQHLKISGYDVIDCLKRRHRDVNLFVRLAMRMRREQIDILHCHDELSWFYGTIGAWLGGIPRIVVTMHGRRPDISPRHRWEQRLLTRLTTAMVCVSSYLRQQVLDEIRASPHKLVVIPNGMSLGARPYRSGQRKRARDLLGLPANAVVIGWVGRLAAIKNLDLLLDAAAEARASVGTLRVVLIGEGPCRERLSQKAARLHLADAVL